MTDEQINRLCSALRFLGGCVFWGLLFAASCHGCWVNGVSIK